MAKPNLIIFLTDQQRADTMACYQNSLIHAPNLNKLAAASVIFERAYVTQPLCVPSRASLFTGMWPHRSGCTRNGVSLDPKHLVLPQLLPDRDYHFGYMGKWQLGNENLAQRGFDTWISTEGVSDYSQFLLERGYAPDKKNGSFSESAVSNLPLEVSKPRFLQEHACRYIQSKRASPFVLVLSFVEPHSPYNGPLNHEHSLAGMELDPTALAPASDDIPLRYRLLREWQQSEAALDRNRLPELYFFGLTPEEYRGIRQRYFGLVTMLDQSVGAVLECVDEAGLTDDTVIIFTSDHGDMLGAHHLFAKEVMFEEATRVPFLVRMPGQRSATRVAQPVSQIDFLPTVLDLLGAPKPSQCAGDSLVPLLRGDTLEPRNVFIEWSPNRAKVLAGSKLAKRWAIKRAVSESTRTVITPDGWKLSLRDQDLNELYNLDRDPIEAHNLFNRPGHDNIIARGRNDLRRWQKKVGDRLKL